MTLLIAFAVLSAVCTMYLIAPIASTHKWWCYILILIIPAISLGIYIKTGVFGFKNAELSAGAQSHPFGFKNAELSAGAQSHPLSQALEISKDENEEQNLRKMLDSYKGNITALWYIYGTRKA